MSALSPDDFNDFFHELHGYPPFPWQDRLARRVCRLESGASAGGTGWPDVLDLPTASGKTACIEIAVFALAMQADRPVPERTAPCRIFFVVDRRVIVDQAYRRASDLADALRGPSGDQPTLRRVADRLRQLAGPDAAPLDAYQLRGGIYLEDGWARTPTQPVIVASTVDQVGSRLLFRGYGVAPGSRPIHAGLIGNDALILLDEAHCSRPFGQTLAAVRRYRGETWAERPLETPFAVTRMTATPGEDAAGSVFALDEDDRQDEVLADRLAAHKPARLRKVKGETATPRFARALVDEARGFAEDGRERIAIVVNRVATARAVYDELAGAGDEAVVLLTGRMRPFDRDRLMKDWSPRRRHDGRAAKSDADGRAADGGGSGLLHWLGTDRDPAVELERPIFVVATQCIEVGADLDFDAMVSECASLDALRQRFGRLDRLGRVTRDREHAPAVVVAARDDLKKRSHDYIYGDALRETWEWLQRHEDELDFGAVAMDALVRTATESEPVLVRRLQAPAPDAPVMLPAYVDCWAQTRPEPAPDPDPAPFLHGPEQGAAEVQLCWRADLEPERSEDDSAREDRWTTVVGLCPPVSAECLPVPIHAARRWLTGGEETDRELSDVVGTAGDSERNGSNAIARPRRPLAWRGPDDSRLLADARELKPGDTLVLPVEAEGWAALGHIPEGAEATPREDAAAQRVTIGQTPESHHQAENDLTAAGRRASIDIAEAAHRVSGRRMVLRLHPAALTRWPDLPERGGVTKAVGAWVKTGQATDLREALGRFADALRERAGTTSGRDTPDWLLEAAVAMAEHGLEATTYPEPSAGDEIPEASPVHALTLRGPGRFRPDPDRSPAGVRSYDGEADETSATRTPIDLERHLDGVRDYVRAIAGRLGLPIELAECMVEAARCHDLGKVDPRFQAMLRGGDSFGAWMQPRPLAKGRASLTRAQRERDRRRSGLPRGFRHELLTLRLLDEGAMPARFDPVGADLVRYLVMTHHGWCRPFAPVVPDPDPPDVVYEAEDGSTLTVSGRQRAERRMYRLDSGITERFWVTVRRYGWWGAAYLEAVLRLADHRRSEDEETGAAQSAKPEEVYA